MKAFGPQISRLRYPRVRALVHHQHPSIGYSPTYKTGRTSSLTSR